MKLKGRRPGSGFKDWEAARTFTTMNSDPKPCTCGLVQDPDMEMLSEVRQRAVDSIPGDSSGEEDSDSDADGAPADKDNELDLDVDVNLLSPFLCNTLSDERPALNFRGFVVPVANEHAETRNHEPTEEQWADE